MPATGPSTAVWIELDPERDTPPDPPAATWFRPPSASIVEIEIEPGAVAVTWRVEVDGDGQLQACIEQHTEPLGEGRQLLWIPPAPRAFLAVVPSTGRVRVWVLQDGTSGAAVARFERRLWRWAADPSTPRPDLPAVAGDARLLERLAVADPPSTSSGEATTSRLRRDLLEGRLELLGPGSPHLSRARRPARAPIAEMADGERRSLQLMGPALLVMDTWARTDGLPPPTPVPYDMVVRTRGGEPVTRMATGSLIPGESDPTGRAVGRRLIVPVPPAPNRWEASVEGSDVEVRFRAYRARPRFPSLPDAGRLRALPSPAGDLSEVSGAGSAGTGIRAALAGGQYSEAATLLTRWWERAPGNRDALIALAAVQARVDVADAQLPAALPALEWAVLARDRSGERPADRQLRGATRAAWLHATAYVTRGVRAPEPREPIVLALPRQHPLAEPGPDGRYGPGIHGFLPSGQEVILDPGPGAEDPDRWTVVDLVGLNLTGRPAVVTLQVDDTEPLRVLLDGPATPFRVALAPGPRRVRLALPPGAGEQIVVAADLPVDAPGAGPWGPAHPHLRTLRTTRVEAGAASERFELPAGHGATHLRVDAWWSGGGARSLVVETAAGRRSAILYPTDDAPALSLAGDGPADGDGLVGGAAGVDFAGDVGWVRLHALDDEGPLWTRVSVRAPRPHPLEEDDPSLAVDRTWTRGPLEADLRRLSQLIAASRDPDEIAAARVARAELLLGLDLPGYARRDLAAARSAGTPPADLDRLADAARSIGGPHHTVVHTAPTGPALPLDVAAVLGPGQAAWLDELPDDDVAHSIASGDLVTALGAAPFVGPLHLALATAAIEEAAEEPDAAVRALLHATAARAVAEDADAAHIVQLATTASRPDHLKTAAASPDRVLLSGPRSAPDPLADPARWARWSMLGASLSRVDQVLAAGTRWVVRAGDDAPGLVTLEVLCDDLREPHPGTPDRCHLTLQVEGGEAQSWEVPRGEVGRRSAHLETGRPLAITLAREGHARYAAVALRANDPSWRVADRQAWFHVARPGEPVCYRVTGPTRLEIEATPRAGGNVPIRLQVRSGDGPLAELAWDAVDPAIVSDQGVGYGAVEPLLVNLFEGGEVDVHAHGGAVAVRVTRRVGSELVLPSPPVLASGDVPRRGGRHSAPALPDARSPALGLRLPRPSPGGTVEATVRFWDRWSADLELTQQRYQYVEIGVAHRVRLGRGESWFHGGGLARIGFTAGPSFVLALGTHHRIRPVDLRITARAQALVQDTDQGVFGALALSARLDRPTRLAPDLTIVPYLRLRGFVQPQQELEWFARRLDMELASDYRRAHPLGLGGGAELVWRPWVDGAWLIGLRALSNPALDSLDNAGGHVELRLHPRPVGGAVRFDLSHRFQDDWRPEGWWRAEFVLDLWADLGPPSLWVRPTLRLGYLFQPSRLEATVGLTVTPGRRGAYHVSPADLPFGDLRAPVAIDGRWVR